ncbi:MAG: DUF1737 domain-containing protein [Anaerolineae bacterium]|nr:DUF1737 domain-containing protein [Anaerolineae bacterium]
MSNSTTLQAVLTALAQLAKDWRDGADRARATASKGRSSGKPIAIERAAKLEGMASASVEHASVLEVLGVQLEELFTTSARWPHLAGQPTRQEHKTVIGHEDTFDDRVNGYLAEGWQLHGAPTCVWDECRFLYTQSLVRDVPTKPQTDEDV